MNNSSPFCNQFINQIIKNKHEDVKENQQYAKTDKLEQVCVSQFFFLKKEEKDFQQEVKEKSSPGYDVVINMGSTS